MTKNKKENFNDLFWFFENKTPDLKKDKNLLIHQVLSYGTMEDVRRLFKVCGRSVIRREFKKPRQGLYKPSVFELFRNLLEIKKIDREKYIKKLI